MVKTSLEQVPQVNSYLMNIGDKL